MPTIGERLQHAWNAFRGRDHPTNYYDYGIGYSYRPDRRRLSRGNERSIVTAVYNRIAMDVAAVTIHHVRIDENERYRETIRSGLDSALNVEANIDQTGRDFIQDLVLSMFDEGVVAIVPVDTSFNPLISDSYDIHTLRTGRIVSWYPQHVRVEVYNEKNGRKEEITLPKKMVGIIPNPLYAVMNEPNSTLQRLIRKLTLMDVVDEKTNSDKLDMIIQLPYTVKSEVQKNRADQRRKDIEMQLVGSRYGIAYVDATEKITQLNRPIENKLMSQIEYLTNMLYNQLGLSPAIFDGTADEQTMLNYNNRTIEPILSAIVNEMRRKFLTKTARTQGQTIMFFKDPFRLVPVNAIAEIADKFTRNEIMSPNEIRQIIGIKPSDQEGADELKNRNIASKNEDISMQNPQENMDTDERKNPMEYTISEI